MPKIAKISLNLLKLHIQYCRLFFPDTVYNTLLINNGIWSFIQHDTTWQHSTAYLPGLVHVLTYALRWNNCVRQLRTSSRAGTFLYSKMDDEDASMLNNGSSKIRLRRSSAKCDTGNFAKFQLCNMWPGMYVWSLLWQHRQKYLPKYSQ